jgi:hypothetical protein
MRVAGAAQDSGRGVSVNPGGQRKPMGVFGASASERESLENRVAVETAWRMP